MKMYMYVIETETYVVVFNFKRNFRQKIYID